MTLKQLLKSRTMVFNAVVTLAVTIAPMFGYIPSANLITAIYGVGNSILRLITTESISAK